MVQLFFPSEIALVLKNIQWCDSNSGWPFESLVGCNNYNYTDTNENYRINNTYKLNTRYYAQCKMLLYLQHE